MNKVKIQRKSSTSRKKSKLILFFEDSRIKLKRRIDKYFPTINITKRLSSSSFYQSFKSRLSLNQRNFKISKRFLIITLLGLLIFFLLSLNLIKLISIKSTNNSNLDRQIDNYEINLGFVIYQQLNDYGQEYRYISSANIITIRQNEVIVLNYDPRFEIGGGTFLTLLNRLENDDLNYKLMIEDTLKDLSGLRVDGTIVFEEKKFKQFLDQLRFNTEEYNRSNFEIINSEGGKIEFDELKQSNQVVVLRELFNNGFTILNKYLYFFWNYENIIDLFDSTLSTNNLISVFNSLGIQKRVLNIVFDRNVSNIVANEDQTFSMIPSRPLFKERYLDQYKDLIIFSEQAEVEIYNASNVSGLASQSASRLSNIGVSVTRTGNFSDRIDEATIFIKEENDVSKFKETIAAIKRNIDADFKIKLIDEIVQISGDIMVVIK